MKLNKYQKYALKRAGGALLTGVLSTTSFWLAIKSARNKWDVLAAFGAVTGFINLSIMWDEINEFANNISLSDKYLNEEKEKVEESFNKLIDAVKKVKENH